MRRAAAREHGQEIGRRVLGPAAPVDREGRPVRPDRPRQAVPVLAHLLGALGCRERVSRVEGLVQEVEIDVPPQRPVAGHRHDVDERHSCHPAVVLRREHVEAGQPDGSDLRLRGKLAPREAVHANHRPGGRQRLQRGLHLVGIVRQGVDLLAREHRTERAAARVQRRGLAVAAHGDRLVELLDLQGRAHTGFPSAHPDVAENGGVKPRELHLDAVTPLGHALEHGDTRAVGGDRTRPQ